MAALLPPPCTLGLPADRHPAAVYLARLAPGSRPAMRQALDLAARIISSGAHDAETLDWTALRYQHTQAIRTALADRFAPATANKVLAAVRGTLREAWRLGCISAEDYRRAADLQNIRGERLPAGRALSAGELRALFRACQGDPSPAGRRDAAMLAVLYGSGLRRAEAVALDLEDYHADARELRVTHGKGAKERLVYLASGGKELLDAWVAVRGPEPGPLFYPMVAHRLTSQRPSLRMVAVMLAKRAKQAGVVAFSPHDLRRSFISDLLDAGADISTAQKLAGHAQVTTTQRYDRRGEAAKRRTASLLHLPVGG